MALEATDECWIEYKEKFEKEYDDEEDILR